MQNNTSYWTLSRSPYYSFIFTLPLFAVYEVMVLFLSRDQVATLRNGADVLMRQFLALFGAWGAYVLSVAFIIGFMVVFLFQKKNWSITAVRGEYLLQMLLEGTLWGVLLYVVMKYSPVLLMFPSGKMLSQQIILSIGAGLYEEFVFRVFAIALISQILKFIFLWKKVWRILAAIFISACLFSGFHFVGAFGEPFNLMLFFYRLFAGVLLGSLYVTRGFGITAYAHMVYDFVVVFNLTIR
ncbi:MAG: CPBP family glutamic-type intramembrane protease [Candidatus Marinimicrobia bacterium]|jgi:membrane protease YdiL (CAAX protease family)|nr:CPBP family glutamic-type intramembrane protease [Candidatus Neomarinimicrobiota bacterium]